MKQNQTLEEQKKQFLQQVANEYRFFQRDREIFLARFDAENGNSKNTEIAQFLGMDRQEFQDYLGTICDSLGFKSTNQKGRNKKGESPWEKAFTWLWNEKFIQQTNSNNFTPTNSEAAEKLLNNSRQVCQKILTLTQKQRLTTNPLTNIDGTTFDYKDVCISLGLMERKKQQKIHKDFSTDSEKTEYEITREFEQSEFFTEVLAQRNSPKSQGRKIAIIGEPGAGKTTKLQTIADWIFEQTEDVAIWISLADLQEKSIEDYLSKVWLKDALKVGRVTPDLEDALVELFKQGRVWLLLDGVDEMAMKNPLQFINSQISGWVAEARIILTCRLNVWDVGKNYLESFDAYRNLDFDSEQVKEFIGKWFMNNSDLGKDLQTELQKPGKERIRDLIKNPLRLTLLCWFWQRGQGSLPETKAGLYKRFVEVFYEWKEWEPDCFATQSEAKEKLEVALGELAVKAIDKNSSRFRLSHREVCQVLGDVDTPLFKLVMKLGWLNKVGVAEENPDEDIYAFFHPTFQEYFAAINIGDRYFFLNHIPENPDRGTYRIFESKWKEVFLLWLGRDDVDKDEKEELTKALVEFEDGCGNFYWYQAYFLAASGIAEFKECIIAKVIVERVVLFYLMRHISLDIERFAAKTLLETDYTIATNLLTSFLNKNESNSIPVSIDAANLLIEIRANIEKVISTLTKIIETCNNSSWKEYAANVLLKIDPENIKGKEIFLASDSYIDQIEESHRIWLHSFYLKNSIIIDNLVINLCNIEDKNSCLQAAMILAEMDICNNQNINYIIECIQDDSEEKSLNQLIYSIVYLLGEIGSIGLKHPEIITYLIKLLDEKKWYSNISEIETNEKVADDALESPLSNVFGARPSKYDWIVFYQTAVVKTLGEIGYKNPNAIDALNDIIHSKRHIKIRYQAAISLGKIDPGNQEIIPLIIHLLINQGVEKTIFQDIIVNMIKAAKDILIQEIYSNYSQKLVAELKGFLSEVKPNFSYNYLAVKDILWHCAQNMTYPEFYHAWHSHNSTIKNLENQITDISKQLQPTTTKTYPIFINASPLKDETETQAIAQEIYNQIHQTVYPNNDNIPEVNNAPQLKRLIPKIKTHLDQKPLALIFHKSDPHPEILAFCHKLTNALHIAWLTDSPLEPPLRGFPPNQPNLKSALETWLNEIGD